MVRRGGLAGFSGFDVLLQGCGQWAGWRMLFSTTKRDDRDERLRRCMLMIGAPYMATAWAKGLTAWEAQAVWWEVVTGPLFAFTPLGKEIAVRRIDICAEQWMTKDGKRKRPLWSREDLDNFITRSKAKGKARAPTQFPTAHWSAEGWTWESTTGTTFYLGKRGGKSRHLRIYDKMREAHAHGTEHFWRPFLSNLGWDGMMKGAPTIWRLEIEHGGDWLANHGFESADQLVGAERALWRDYTKKTKHTRTRSKEGRLCVEVTPQWKSVQAATDLPQHEAWSYTTRPKPEADPGVLQRMTAGCLRNLAERERELVGCAFFDDGATLQLTARERIGRALSRVQQVMADAMLKDGEITEYDHQELQKALIPFHTATTTMERTR